MAMHFSDLWRWQGVSGRSNYTVWGILLFLLKYNLDRLIAILWFDQYWFPWNYFSPSRGLPSAEHANMQSLFIVLLICSMPFIAMGVGLTLRRLRDVGWPASLVSLFFIPFVNAVFFVLLCVQPGRQHPSSNKMNRSWLRRVMQTDKAFTAALLGISASSILGVGLTAFGALFLQNYGWGLFIGIPFMMGLLSALIYSNTQKRTCAQCISVAILSVLLTGVLFIGLAIEGIICVAMALPFALLLAILGAIVGYWIQKERWSRELDNVRLYTAAWIVLPIIMAAEAQMPAAPPLIEATTICDIAASREVVWDQVINFSEIPPPTENLFRAGIAYPIRARLDRHGVGGVRHCEFSTGSFVEPITVWDEGRHLAFDVESQPHPMREWSPYSKLSPAHLDGFFRSKRGEFRLTTLPNGHTRLEGTTWYEQDIWPQAYWQVWSNYLIHTIHHRVLNHIKIEAEQSVKRKSAVKAR